jgi:hypothetical protein
MDLTVATNSAHRVNGARRNTDREIIKREIVDYEEQMLALESPMVDLKHRRFALNEKLNRTSPIISMLPLDVISEIFLYTRFKTSVTSAYFERLSFWGGFARLGGIGGRLCGLHLEYGAPS